MHHIRSRKSRAGDENSHEIYVEISVAGSPSSSCAGDDVVDRLRRSDVIVHVTSPGDVCSSTIRFSSCLIAFLPQDAMLSRYMLSSCVRLSVCHKPVLYRNTNWTNRAGVWYGCFLSYIPDCVIRKFGYFQILTYFPLGFCSKL